MCSGALRTFLDKRELQEAIRPASHDFSSGGELWIDYVADTGDGFDATYTIASLLAQVQYLREEGELEVVLAQLARPERRATALAALAGRCRSLSGRRVSSPHRGR